MRQLTIASILALSLFMLSGCGGSDGGGGPTKPTGKKNGDLNDPEFQMTQSQISYVNQQSMSGLQQVYTLAGGMVMSAPERQYHASASGVADFGYDSVSSYWYYDYAYAYWTGTDSVMFSMVDSFQFMHGDVAVQYPDSQLLTAMRVNYRYLLDYSSGDSLAYGMNITMSGLPGAIANKGEVTVDGSGYFRGRLTYAGGGLSCEYDYGFASAYDSLALSLLSVFSSGGCPDGGSLIHSGMFAVLCTGSSNVDYGGEWSAELNYDGASIAYIYQNASTSWTGDSTCAATTSAALPEQFQLAQKLSSQIGR